MFIDLILLSTLCGAFLAAGASAQPANTRTAPALAIKSPQYFEENLGQYPEPVRYGHRGEGFALLFEDHDVVIAAPETKRAVRVRFVNADPGVAQEGLEPLPGTVTFFAGAEHDPSARVPIFARVVYRALYPGIDLVFRFSAEGLVEWDLVLAPGADPEPIEIDLGENSGARVTESGDLIIATGDAEIVWRKPVAYQVSDGGRQAVPSTFEMDPSNHRLRFRLGRYDARLGLTIDPVISYVRKFGGDFDDAGIAIALDRTGNVYVAGVTWSPNFPRLPPETPDASGPDANVQPSQALFITKFDKDGSTMLYSAVFTGLRYGLPVNLAVDGSGAAYFTARGSMFDSWTLAAWVNKLSPDGTELQYAIRLPDGTATTIAVDDDGSAYIAGLMFREGRNCPESFLDKVSPSGDSVEPLLRFGSAAKASPCEEKPTAIALDHAGNLYIAGYSKTDSFPTTPGAHREKNPHAAPWGIGDGYVMKFSLGSRTLVYSTLLGGSGQDKALAVAADREGNAYVAGTGQVEDIAEPFPGQRAGIYFGRGPDSVCAFVAKLDPSGSRLAYSNILSSGAAQGLALDEGGRVWAAVALGGEFTFWQGSVDKYRAGAALFRLTAGGGRIDRAMRLGRHTDVLTAVALGADGAVYATGSAVNSGSLSLAGPERATADAFLVKLGPDDGEADLSVRVLSHPPVTLPGSIFSLRMAVRNDGPSDAKNVRIEAALPGLMMDCYTDDWLICDPTGASVARIPTLRKDSEVTVTFISSLALNYYGEPPSSFSAAVLPEAWDPDLAGNVVSSSIPFEQGAVLSVESFPNGLLYKRSDLEEARGRPGGWSKATGNAPTWGWTRTARIGKPLTIQFASPQKRYGMTYVFHSWLDGNADNPRTFDVTNFYHDWRALFEAVSPLATMPAAVHFTSWPGWAPRSEELTVVTAGMQSFTVEPPQVHWLTVSPLSGRPSSKVTLTANPAGLPEGTHRTFLTVSVPGESASKPPASIRVPVFLKVQPAAPGIAAAGVVNAASYRNLPVAPGELVALFGEGLGPHDPAEAEDMPDVPESLGGVRVLIRGSPAGLLYVQENQILAMIPRDIRSNESRRPAPLELQLETGGAVSATVELTSIDYQPALFTRGASGQGYAAAVHEDGTINSATNPAPRSSMVRLYATGTAAACASYASTDTWSPGLPVGLEVGGKAADVVSVRLVPGRSCGVQQIKFAIPADSLTGDRVPIRIWQQDPWDSKWVFSSQEGVWLAIR